MEDAIVALILVMLAAMAFVALLPFLVVAGISFLIYKGIIRALRSLKGEVSRADHITGVIVSLLPAALLISEKGWVPGWLVALTYLPAVAWIGVNLHGVFVRRRDVPVKAKKRKNDQENVSPVQPEVMAGDIHHVVPQGNPLSDLYRELGEIMKRDDRNVLLQRLDALKRSMDATTYEKNISSWLRKFKAGIEIVETMNAAELARMDHDLMPLVRREREAKLKADITEHQVRELHAQSEMDRLRQRKKKVPAGPAQQLGSLKRSFKKRMTLMEGEKEMKERALSDGHDPEIVARAWEEAQAEAAREQYGPHP